MKTYYIAAMIVILMGVGFITGGVLYLHEGGLIGIIAGIGLIALVIVSIFPIRGEHP